MDYLPEVIIDNPQLKQLQKQIATLHKKQSEFMDVIHKTEEELEHHQKAVKAFNEAEDKLFAQLDASISEESAKIFTKEVKDRKHTHEQRIVSATSRLREAKRGQSRIVKSLTPIEEQLEELQKTATGKVSKDSLKNIFADFPTIDQQSIAVGNENNEAFLQWKFQDIYMMPNLNRFASINQGEIPRLKLPAARVRFFPRNNQLYIYPVRGQKQFNFYGGNQVHPHIMSNNEPCLGDWAPAIAEASAIHDWAGVANIIQMFLEHANVDDPAGRTWVRYFSRLHPEVTNTTRDDKRILKLSSIYPIEYGHFMPKEDNSDEWELRKSYDPFNPDVQEPPPGHVAEPDAEGWIFYTPGDKMPTEEKIQYNWGITLIHPNQINWGDSCYYRLESAIPKPKYPENPEIGWINYPAEINECPYHDDTNILVITSNDQHIRGQVKDFDWETHDNRIVKYFILERLIGNDSLESLIPEELQEDDTKVRVLNADNEITDWISINEAKKIENPIQYYLHPNYTINWVKFNQGEAPPEQCTVKAKLENGDILEKKASRIPWDRVTHYQISSATDGRQSIGKGQKPDHMDRKIEYRMAKWNEFFGPTLASDEGLCWDLDEEDDARIVNFRYID